MKILALATLTIAGLTFAVPSFGADISAPADNAVAAPRPPAGTVSKPAHTHHKRVNPHVLARPTASPNNGAASAIGAQ